MVEINVWPEWTVIEKLGQGAYGIVYKAKKVEHGIESCSAIKVISINHDSIDIDLSSELNLEETRTYRRAALDELIQDFIMEINTMLTLKGASNIVCIEDFKISNNLEEGIINIYIRMELLTPLKTYLETHKLTEQEVIKLGIDLCTALEICEKRNIIHRDIKQENIFVNEFGEFKLGDFGIARKMENMTNGMSSKGTYAYAAPEVIKADHYDARVDIYSLGLVLYQLLNKNALPFTDLSTPYTSPIKKREAMQKRIQGEEIPKPCDASEYYAQVLLKACQYRPENRYSNITEMKQALLKKYENVPMDTMSMALRHSSYSQIQTEKEHEEIPIISLALEHYSGQAYKAHIQQLQNKIKVQNEAYVKANGSQQPPFFIRNELMLLNHGRFAYCEGFAADRSKQLLQLTLKNESNYTLQQVIIKVKDENGNFEPIRDYRIEACIKAYEAENPESVMFLKQFSEKKDVAHIPTLGSDEEYSFQVLIDFPAPRFTKELLFEISTYGGHTYEETISVSGMICGLVSSSEVLYYIDVANPSVKKR